MLPSFYSGLAIVLKYDAIDDDDDDDDDLMMMIMMMSL